MATKRAGRRSKSKTSKRKVVAVTRTVDALELRRRGKSFAAIGKDLGVSRQAAHKAVTKALRDLCEEGDEKAAELRELESQRLDEMWAALQRGIEAGDPTSIDKGIKIVARRAALYGLDAPSKTELTGKDGGAVQIGTWEDMVRQAMASDEPTKGE